MSTHPDLEPADGLPAPTGWPEPLHPHAYQGLVGAIVEAIAPHTEADPVAILGQLLIGAGSIIGRGAWFEVEANPPSPQRVPGSGRRFGQGPQGILLGSRGPPALRRRPRLPGPHPQLDLSSRNGPTAMI